MRFSIQSRCQQGLALALGMLYLLTTPATCLADVLHFQNGKVMRGKLNYATGELLEFHSGGLLGNTQSIPRLHLSNRHDMIKTLARQTYYGEIIYIDSFQVDIKTSSGMLRLNRWKIAEIVMGTPMEQPTMPNAPMPNTVPISFSSTINPDQPALRGMAPEAGQTIPAVDQ